jgi:hypothetical protein
MSASDVPRDISMMLGAIFTYVFLVV